MGIRFSGNQDLYMRYSTFGEIREVLFTASGLGDINEMVGYAEIGGRPWSDIDDALVKIWNAQDDYGHIEYEDLQGVIDRLEELIPKCRHDLQKVMWLLVKSFKSCHQQGYGCGWS